MDYHGRQGEWIKNFRHYDPQQSRSYQEKRSPSRTLPSFFVTPSFSGPAVIRASLPFHFGAVRSDDCLIASCDNLFSPVELRPLGMYPGSENFVRRGMVTIPWQFRKKTKLHFSLKRSEDNQNYTGWYTANRLHLEHPIHSNCDSVAFHFGGTNIISTTSGAITIQTENSRKWEITPIAPILSTQTSFFECIEKNPFYIWIRLLIEHTHWPRIIEIKADATGNTAILLHLQRMAIEDGYSPDLGWTIQGPPCSFSEITQDTPKNLGSNFLHSFSSSKKVWFDYASHRLSFPDGHCKAVGILSAQRGTNRSIIQYHRASSYSHVPHQPTAWRSAGILLHPSSQPVWTPLWEPALTVHVDPKDYAAAYHWKLPQQRGQWPRIDNLIADHHELICRSVMTGDDWGNICHLGQPNSIMNRLNNAPLILREAHMSGDLRLRNVMVGWCQNFHNLSIWWGQDTSSGFGGTRYPEIEGFLTTARRPGRYAWRSNSGIGFCTKGIDSFIYSYEETGDPRMSTAFRHQAAFAICALHCNRGESRNIGAVKDLMHCYTLTGHTRFLKTAERLVSELETILSPGYLFSQNCQPIEKDPPFIDDDEKGYKHPFAKPYILSYALIGLPSILPFTENKNVEQILRTISRFMLDTQDPSGAWRYPHPHSSTLHIAIAMEHARGLIETADAIGSDSRLFQSLMAVLRLRILPWIKATESHGRSHLSRADCSYGNSSEIDKKDADGAGTDANRAHPDWLLSGLPMLQLGWEKQAGLPMGTADLHTLYSKPEERESMRDYSEGPLSFGAIIEGIVSFFDVLDYYLQSGSPEDILQPPKQVPTEQNPICKSVIEQDRYLSQILNRIHTITPTNNQIEQQ